MFCSWHSFIAETTRHDAETRHKVLRRSLTESRPSPGLQSSVGVAVAARWGRKSWRQHGHKLLPAGVVRWCGCCVCSVRSGSDDVSSPLNNCTTLPESPAARQRLLQLSWSALIGSARSWCSLGWRDGLVSDYRDAKKNCCKQGHIPNASLPAACFLERMVGHVRISPFDIYDIICMF